MTTLVNITRCPKCGHEGGYWLTTPTGPVFYNEDGKPHVCPATLEDLL